LTPPTAAQHRIRDDGTAVGDDGEEQPPSAKGISSGGSSHDHHDSSNVLASNPRPWLPKELWFLCDALFRYGCKEPGLFGLGGSTEDDDQECDTAVGELIEFLDSEAAAIPSNRFSARVVSRTLVHFFSLLQEPLVPYGLFTAALAAARTGGRAPLTLIQQQMPAANGNVWLYLMSMLNFLLRPGNQERNLLTAQGLADVFANVLFRRRAPGGGSVVQNASPSSSGRIGYSSSSSTGGGDTPATGAAATSSSSTASLSSSSSGSQAGSAAGAGGGQESLRAQAYLRQQLQQERSDAAQLVLFFLQQPASTP
jgi:hypothetical protein